MPPYGVLNRDVHRRVEQHDIVKVVMENKKPPGKTGGDYFFRKRVGLAITRPHFHYLV